MKRKKYIEYWRNAPIFCKTNIKKKYPNINNIFPSGRQSITYILKKNKINRSDKVVIPEWSSNCLHSAVSKIAKPIFMNEYLKNKSKIKVLIIYYQWGWENLNSYKKILNSSFKNIIIILDKVDNLDIFKINNQNENKINNKNIFSVYSFSKIIGLQGGSIISNNKKLLKINYSKKEISFLKLFEKIKINNKLYSNKIEYIKKSDIFALPDSVKKWFSKNSLKLSVKNELKKRKINFNIILKSSLTNKWPKWMKNHSKESNIPNAVPLFRGFSDQYLEKKMLVLKKNFKLESKIYHFNWSGNPFLPKYKKCLMVPIHGLVFKIDRIIDKLEK